MKKLSIAWVRTETKDGWRTYKAYTKDEKMVFSIQCHDHGHGAAMAYDKVREKFNVSSADWAYAIGRKYGEK